MRASLDAVAAELAGVGQVQAMEGTAERQAPSSSTWPGGGRTLSPGPDLIAAGWVALPSIILERQDALGLDAIDINVILHIAKHWFEPGNLPHPSKGSIAKAMQVTPRTIQKRFSSLDASGFVQRIERRGPKGTKGSQTSKFDFSGLTKAATPFAIEALQERKKKREERLARLGRKRPKIDADVVDSEADPEDVDTL